MRFDFVSYLFLKPVPAFSGAAFERRIIMRSGRSEATTLSGLTRSAVYTQGSLPVLRQKHYGGKATLGFVAESLWDSSAQAQEALIDSSPRGVYPARVDRLETPHVVSYNVRCRGSSMMLWLAAFCLLTAAFTGICQSLSFNTVAGYSGHGSTNGSAGAVRFNNPWGVAVDSSGNVYVADTDNHCVRKLSGVTWTTLAGQPGTNGSANGTGASASFNQPQGVAVDGVGNVYVADTGNHTIRKITAGGVVTTLAGLAGSSGTTDATGGSARFYEPEGIAVNSAGTTIYVADTWNHTIRLVNAAGTVSTFAGTAGIPGTNNATGTSASFNTPQGVALDSVGNVYVADTGNDLVRKITTAGAVSTLAGVVGVAGTNNGTGTAASFWGPASLGVDSANNVYVADLHNNAIRKITSAAVVTTFAGSMGTIGFLDGTLVSSRFWLPGGIASDGSGNLYIADTGNGTLRKYTVAGSVTTIGGSSSIGSADVPASPTAKFFWPSGIAIDNSGNSYVVDSANGTIRTVSSNGLSATFTGVAGSFGGSDGLLSNARFYGPAGAALDTSGNLYVSDSANHTIRKIASGSVSTFAGTSGSSGISDGTTGAARFNYPRGLKADTSGNIYVADSQNHTIRKLTSAGVVTTFAGVAGIAGDIDGTSAGTGTNVARFDTPCGIAVDNSGNVFVADTENHTIRKITSGGVVSTLSGMAGVYGAADGTNTDARFNLPTDLAWDFNGNLYVLDSGNHAVRLVKPSGTNWVVTTVAGTPGLFGANDGTGPSASFWFPGALAINNVGSFVMADTANNEIRATGPTFNQPPSVVQQPQDQTANQGQNAIFNVLANGSPTLVYQWQLYSTNIPGATGSSYTRTNCQAVDAGPYSVFITNNLGTMLSSNAMLTVMVPPTITSQPQGTNVDQGTTANFSVAASGTLPFAYQWLFNGTNISGASADSYSVTNAQPADAGNYSVIVSNSAGSVTSMVATLAVNLVATAPMVTGQPPNRTVAQGSNATFTVTATGSTPLAYQWNFSGTEIPAATGASYTRVAAQPGDAGAYQVVVTNQYGAATSSVATLSVVLPPVISLQPSNQLAAVSNSAMFAVGLSQGDSPAYQWYRNGATVAGGTQATLIFSSITWSNAGAYKVVVTNLAGNVTSVVANLTAEQAAFTFVEDFESYAPGGLDKNTVGSANTAASNPWWAVSTTTPDGWLTNSGPGVNPHSGAKMIGATNTVRQDYLNLVYRFNAGQLYYGNFMLEWWFYDSYGANSSGATNMQDYIALCQNAPLPTNSDTSGGSFTTFNQRLSLGTFNSAGYNYSNYQARVIGGSGGTFGSGNSWYNTSTVRSIGWHHARIIMGIPNFTNAAPVSMFIDDMLTPAVTSPTAGTNGFNLIEMNHQFSKLGYLFYYDDLTFRADNDPWIIEQPVSQTVNAGQAVSFNTVAVGTAYQWQLNGTNIPGATTSSYNVAAAGSTNAGTYACLISGANGVLPTTPAILSLIAPAQPGHFDSQQLLGDGSIQLFMSGTPYTNYTLEFTPDLGAISWNPLTNLSGTNGLFQFNDFSSTSNSQRFYRLRVAP